MKRILCVHVAVLGLLTACALSDDRRTDNVVITVIGTNDVHGELSARQDRGGLTTFSGYVDALRATRDADDGAVLLIDAGDMWQGTLESNLTEGAAVVAAYNALGYAAATIGNHEFDFGPTGQAAIPDKPGDDPRGALKQRATEASFPLLAANLIDVSTGVAVQWPNVQPSVLVEASGVTVGIIGVVTANALKVTIAANVVGLEIAPLAPVIETEARALRDAGADLVIVTAHAGSRCTDFEDPNNLSSCNEDGEIFRVARALPNGLVNHIIAGHEHQGIAHIVNGTSITSNRASTYTFGRVDFTIDPRSGEVVSRQIFPPQRTLAGATYEGRKIDNDAEIVSIADRARQFAKSQKEKRLGIRLGTAFTLDGNPESTLGNLFTDALLGSIDADIAIHNVGGGLRANIPAGDLTFGDVYEVSPFENRVVVVDLSGADLRRVVASQAHRGSRSMGFSGMQVAVTCSEENMAVRMILTDGREISDTDTISVVANDYLAFGGDDILAPAIPDGGFDIDPNMPLTRDVFVKWLSDHGGIIHASEFTTADDPKWKRPAPLSSDCRLRQNPRGKP